MQLATIDGKTYQGATLDEIIMATSAKLGVDGPRTIYCEGEGYEVQVSLEAGVIEYAKDGGSLYWVRRPHQ